MSTNQTHLTNDEIFELLSNSRRRQVIFLLYDASGVTNLSDLAERIAESEQGDTVTRDEYKRVYISLYQTHIPKLQDYEIVEYDAESKEVTLTDRVEEIIDVFRTETSEPQWWRYYAALAALAAVVLAGYIRLAPENGWVELTVIGLPIAALLLLVSVHFRTQLRASKVPIERLIDGSL